MKTPKYIEEIPVGRVLRVLWLDAVCGPLGWVDKKALPELEIFETVGYKVESNLQTLRLVQSLKYTPKQKEPNSSTVQGVIVIPMGSVLSVKVLR